MRLSTTAFIGSTLLFATAAGASISEDLVAGRQAGMRMSGALVASMKGALDRGEDVKTQGFAARSLMSWAKAVPGMFPMGSDGTPGDALPAVWSDRAGFEGKAAAYTAAATRLADAAKAGDKVAFGAALDEVRASCGACHATYKKD